MQANKHLLSITKIVRLKEIGLVRAGMFTTLANIENTPVLHAIPTFFLPKKTEKITEKKVQNEFFVLKVKGDSMQPRIYEDDFIIVQYLPNINEIPSGDIIVLSDDDDHIIVKQLYKKDNQCKLISYNEAYKPIEFSDDFNVFGKVVGFYGKL